MRQLRERQVPVRIHFLGRRRRIRRIDLHISLPHRLDDRIRMHHVRMLLDPMEILRELILIPLTLLETMQNQNAFLFLPGASLVDSNLRNRFHAVAVPAILDALCQREHRAFAHAVAEVVGTGGDEDGGHEAVLPVVVVRQAAEGGLDTADDDRDVRIEFLEDLRVHRDGVVGTGARLALGRVGVVVTEALGGGIMVHHRVHRPRIDPEIEPRRSQLAEIPQVVPPVGLRYYGNPVAPFLEPPGDDGRPEGRMVHERVAGHHDYVDVIPTQRLHLLHGGREHIRVLGLHLFLAGFDPFAEPR